MDNKNIDGNKINSIPFIDIKTTTGLGTYTLRIQTLEKIQTTHVMLYLNKVNIGLCENTLHLISNLINFFCSKREIRSEVYYNVRFNLPLLVFG